MLKKQERQECLSSETEKKLRKEISVTKQWCGETMEGEFNIELT